MGARTLPDLKRHLENGTCKRIIRSFGMPQWPSRLLTDAGTWTARPAAFVAVGCFIILWLVFDHASFDWHGAATLLTLCMTLVIQRSEHRDTQALQAKLDELLHVHKNARNDLTRLDEKEPEDIEKLRDRERSGD
jgi:low affinity Fe/Cu permease